MRLVWTRRACFPGSWRLRAGHSAPRWQGSELTDDPLKLTTPIDEASLRGKGNRVSHDAGPSLLCAAELGERECNGQPTRGVRMTHGRPAGKPRRKREVAGGSKKTRPPP